MSQRQALLELRGVTQVVTAHGARRAERARRHRPRRSTRASSSRSSASRASGKTTLISLLAGLDAADDAARCCFAGAEVDGAGPERGVVFQSYSLMPWLTVRGNVALAVDAVLRGASRARARTRVVDRYVAMVGLAHAADRRPARALGRHAPARRGRARARDVAASSCCSTSRCRRSTR